MLIIYTDGQSVATEQSCALIPRHSSKGILRTEIALCRIVGVCGAVVYLVSAEVGVYAQCTTGLVVMVFYCC